MDTKEFNYAKERIQRHFALIGWHIRDPKGSNHLNDYKKLADVGKIRLCFDASLFIYSNYFVAKKTNEPEDPASIAKRVNKNIMKIYGMFQESNHIVEMVVCADSESFRKKIWSGYKAGRSVLPFDKNEVIELLGKKMLKFPEMEADDLMYMYATRNENVVIITEDLDMLQAVKGTTVFFRYKQNELLSENEVNSDIEVLKKLIFGCKSDCIPAAYYGEKRFGEKTLEKELQEVDRDNLSNYDFALDFLQYRGYEIDKDIFNLNKNLVIYSDHIYERFVDDFQKINSLFN